MAITGPASYIPTANAFISHWTDVNVELGAAGPLKTKDGKGIADLTALRDDLEDFRDSVQDKLNGVEIAIGFVTNQKKALIARAGEFNRKVRGSLGGSPFERALPAAPQESDGAAVVLEALADIKSLWPRINAATIATFTPPLVLPDGYAVAAFLTDLAALKQSYETLADAEQELKLERERRNDAQDFAYPIMRDYRTALLGAFTPQHALVASLPRLSPEPGSTPDPVQLTGSFNSTTNEATFSFTASTNPKLAKYQLRHCVGTTYSSETEIVIVDIPAGTLTVTTSVGVAAPGDAAVYKLFVILDTDNESGSNAVAVTRPLVIGPP